MEQDIQQLVQAIHDHPSRTVFVAAGAGTQALAWLLGVAGASRTLIEALVPYDWTAFDDFLGQSPPRYVEAETARLMAGRAFTRARWLCAHDPCLVGLACTATIITDRPKRGEHRAHIATWHPERIVWHRLGLAKGARDRAGEEELVSRVILNALAEAIGLERRLALTLGQGDSLAQGSTDLASLVNRLLRQEIPQFHLLADGTLGAGASQPKAMLSGAFNPLHEGHLALAQVAAEMVGQPAVFELTAINADKPALPAGEVVRRVAQFAGRWPVIVSGAATFADKAALYPQTTFVVGFDTAVRVLQPRFYGDSREQMAAALGAIRAQGCRFLVAGRVDETGRFQEASELDVPASFADLFVPVPVRRFRRDISSTHLRVTGQRGSR